MSTRVGRLNSYTNWEWVVMAKWHFLRDARLGLQDIGNVGTRHSHGASPATLSVTWVQLGQVRTFQNPVFQVGRSQGTDRAKEWL